MLLPQSREENIKRIGFLVAATKSIWTNYTDAFEKELKKNWSIGTGPNDNLFIDYQPNPGPGGVVGAAGDMNFITQAAVNFATTATYDVIVTSGTDAASACQQQITNTPVVFASAGDPVYCGLVTNPGNPTGNLTGCSNMQTDAQVVPRRIQVMKNKLTPTKVAVIGYPIRPIDKAINVAVNACQAQNISVATPPSVGYFALSDLQTVQTIQTKLNTLKQQGVDVLLVCSEPVFRSNATNLITAAQNLGMRTMHEFREWHDNGGDQSFGPSFTRLFTKAADMANQLLMNTPVNSIPVFQPSLNTPGDFEQVP
jgi:ABC-type uncharacterized transport system substrate-binding protein